MPPKIFKLSWRIFPCGESSASPAVDLLANELLTLPHHFHKKTPQKKITPFRRQITPFRRQITPFQNLQFLDLDQQNLQFLIFDPT